MSKKLDYPTQEIVIEIFRMANIIKYVIPIKEYLEKILEFIREFAKIFAKIITDIIFITLIIKMTFLSKIYKLQ